MKKLFSSLRSRLILLIVLTSLPGLILTLRASWEERRTAEQEIQSEVIHLAQLASVNQEIFIENVKAFLLTVSHLPSIRNQDLTDCHNVFAHLVGEHFPYYASFYLADLQGNILCSPPDKHVPPDFDNCEHYKNLVGAKDFVISKYHICEHTGKAVISIGYPILDSQDNPMYVLNVSLDLMWINDFAADAHLPIGAEMVVIDQKGTILSYYPTLESWRGKILPEYSVLAELFTRKEGTLAGLNLAGEKSLYAITPMEGTGGNLFVALGFPINIAYGGAERIIRQNLLIQIIITLLAVGAAWILGQVLILRDTQALVTATHRLADGDLNTHVQLQNPQGELGQVAVAFDSMVESLSQRASERDAAEAVMKAYANELEVTNRELRDFANIASHDLQEPLRKIQTFSDLLQNRCQESLDEQGNQYVNRMRAAARRMQELIDDMLSYSRVTTKAGPIQEVDLRKIVQEVMLDLDLLIEQTGAVIQVDSLPNVEADPTQMYQLFTNLIGNAMKFHREDQPPVVQITFQMNNGSSEAYQNGVTDNLWVEMSIHDNGIGFDEKYKDRIFQPFQKLHGPGEYPGTGMGLAICRKIVERHGGTISATSKPGVGSEFTVRLPIHHTVKDKNTPKKS
jgi:signal transduction histidine kinase